MAAAGAKGLRWTGFNDIVNETFKVGANAVAQDPAQLHAGSCQEGNIREPLHPPYVNPD